MKPSENNKNSFQGTKLYAYILLLMCVFAFVYPYIYDDKIQLGGDNAEYYSFARSIKDGLGYRDIKHPSAPPVNAFPPAYPFVMSGIMHLSASTAIQTIFNGIFLLCSIIISFATIRKIIDSKQNADIAVCIVLPLLFNYYLLSFTIDMMSEMLCLLLISTGFYVLFYRYREDSRKEQVIQVILLVCIAQAIYLTRTQSISFAGCVILFLLLKRRWLGSLCFAGGFYLFSLPWMLRNKWLGLGEVRYMSQILQKNVWRPEDGTVSLNEFIERTWDNLFMLVSKALPNSLLPVAGINYEEKYTVLSLVMMSVCLAGIIYGAIRLKIYGYTLLGFLVFNIGIISIWSAPSENRYLITAIPAAHILFASGIYYSIHSLIYFKTARKDLTQKRSYAQLSMFLLVILSFPTLIVLRQHSNTPHAPEFKNYFYMASHIRNIPAHDSIVVSCRKPGLFFLVSGSRSVGYPFTQNDTMMIRSFVADQVNYVCIDQLGYASTSLYLVPAVQKHMGLFEVEKHLANPDTYLMKFNRSKAIAYLNSLDNSSALSKQE